MAKNYHALALKAVKAGKYREAIGLWEKQLEEDPENAKALSHLGAIYYERRMYSKTAHFLTRAIAVGNTGLSIHILLAYSLTHLEKYQEAVSYFEGVIQRDSANIAAYLGLAKTYLKQQKTEQAIEALKTALQFKPNDTNVHWRLAKIYEALGEKGKTEEYYRKIALNKSDSPIVKKAHDILTENYIKERGIDLADLQTLRSENLVKIYGKRQVVKQVSIEVRQGEIVGLLGPNGAGKTTTFYMITGMIRPNAGNIYLNRVLITKMPMYRRARLGIGYLAQEPSIFRKLTVEENILAILQTLNLSRSEREERLHELLAEFNIGHIRKSKGYNLSGGERRRVEISRSLVLHPKFLLLDEPFAGIDPIAVEDIQNIVHELRNKGIGILITDHNVHETLAITDRAYLLFDGRVLKSGSAEYLANDKEAKTLYLGDKFKLDR